jgi:RimJ/RimL family protein N-acetyltransferase
MTEDVILRGVEDSDLPIFFEHQLDPEAVRMAAFASRAHDAFMEHWKKIRAGEGILRTVVFQGNVAGNMVSWNHGGEQNIGYWLGKEYWGKGIASAGLALFLAEVKVRPLHARVAKHNAGSIRVLQKCGFKIAGEGRFPGIDGEENYEFILTLEGRIDGSPGATSRGND